MKIMIINGPNLNLLGLRDPSIYGSDTLDEIEQWVSSHQSSRGCSFIFKQSNYEGKIIDFIHSSIESADGLIINAGALSHYSLAIRDALELTNLPAVEVHISDTNSREDFRKRSVLSDVCIDQVIGKGKHGYIYAVEILLKSND